MDCHECARTGTERTAVATCRFGSVAQCKDHLVAAFHSIAIAIAAFSPTVALATVVGPLIEVPVMLALVWSAMRLRTRLFPDRPAAGPRPTMEAVHAH